jgi:hypothetical protein
MELVYTFFTPNKKGDHLVLLLFLRSKNKNKPFGLQSRSVKICAFKIEDFKEQDFNRP